MLNVFLCDDNQIILQKYSQLLTEIAKKNNVDINIHTFASGEQLLFGMEKNPNEADIIYMDILMGQLNGVETAKKLRGLGCQAEIVYLTSSEEYVFDSFDTNPLQYILKGDTTNEKFEEIFLRAVSLVDKKEKEVFVATNDPVIKKIPLTSISYFEVQNRVITVHFENDEFNFYSTLDKIEEELKDKGFTRTHRSYLINLKYVDKIEKDSVTLITGVQIPLGVTYAKDFKAIFSQYLTYNL